MQNLEKIDMNHYIIWQLNIPEDRFLTNTYFRSSHPDVFCKKGVSQNPQENPFTTVPLLIKLHFYLKRDSATDVFL